MITGTKALREISISIIDVAGRERKRALASSPGPACRVGEIR